MFTGQFAMGALVAFLVTIVWDCIVRYLLDK